MNSATGNLRSRVNMKRRFAAILIAAGAAGLSSCGEEASQVTEERQTVEVSVVERGDLTVFSDYTGTLQGIEQADLKAKIGEAVTTVHVDIGDTVAAGSVLISLDRTGPSSQYQQAKAQYDFAASTLRKMKSLYEEGAISEQDYDDARTAFRVAEANFKAAREIVDIISPISGVVTGIKVNVGDEIPAGRKVATVSRVDSLRLVVGVDPGDIEYIETGMPVIVYQVGDRDTRAEGRVGRVAVSADPETRAFDVEVVLAGGTPKLRPGTFAVTSFPLRQLRDVVVVKDDAVLLQEGIRKIFVVRGDSALMRDIETGESSLGRTHVLSGVEAGDTVVTLGQAFLPERSAVSIQAAENDPE